MIAGRKFHFRPVLTICAGVALVILLSLGNWQLQRLEWKRDLIEKVEARIAADPIPFSDAVARAAAGEDVEYSPVYVTGALAPTAGADVFGTLEGDPGRYVFRAATQKTDPAVFVNLGFLSHQQRDWVCPCDEESFAEMTITGLFRYPERPAPPASWFRSEEKSEDGLWFVRKPSAFAADLSINAAPYYIDSFAIDGAGWPKGGTTRLDFRNKHFEYALTWFGLAGALLAIWLAMSISRK